MEDLAIHIIIPDTQVKPGVRMDHLRWIGQFIVDKFAGRPNVTIIHIGDHADMPSLSHWDKGKKSMEGRRVIADIEAANTGFQLLNQPIIDYNVKQKAQRHKLWEPRRVITLGNHEDRITRAVEDDAQLEGFLSLDHLNYAKLGWEVIPYLQPVFIDGVGYCHFWYNPMTGRPYGGLVSTRLKTIGHSFTMGHQQLLDYGMRFVRGQSQHGLVAGACYLHDEEYKGAQGNAHWRGIVICNDVENGSYNPSFLTLDYLCRRFEGMRLEDYLGG